MPGISGRCKVGDRLDASAETLTDMMAASDKGIPRDLMDKARCVVVVPGMKKAGFILGAKYGRGFAVCRRPGGVGWSAPAEMRVEGGSVGFQIGASETDIVLLVMNEGGMNHLLSDKFTIGGDATGAAGQVERATSLLDDIHHCTARIEGLHGAVEMVLRRAFDAKDLKSAVAAIKAAADLLREGREYLELRGTVTGELDSPATMINPIFGEQRIQVLALPKCADVMGHVPLDATNSPTEPSPSLDASSIERRVPAAHH